MSKKANRQINEKTQNASTWYLML